MKANTLLIPIFRIQASNSIICGYFCIVFIDFVFAGKTLVHFTSLFSPYDFEKIWQYNFELFQRWIVVDWQNKFDWSKKFRLNEISKNENYFKEEINHRKTCSKKPIKYVSAFDYIDKSATSGGVCIFSSVLLELQLE